MSKRAKSGSTSLAKTAPTLRGRVWIDIRSVAAITEAGADLLEQIEASGSLSQAARRLRFSYRRAWLLLDAMNRRWPGPLVTTAIGGKRGGGAKLTPRGRAVLSAYRDLQVQLETMLDHAAEHFRRSVASQGD
ncbi:MAG: molybdate transport system regulatory protein [Phycisphaerales bacterium]|jgi:molybdate transport system regulatory protein|nr:molybdate transport system regulatory protein [Phycisphaerales bacterium]